LPLVWLGFSDGVNECEKAQFRRVKFRRYQHQLVNTLSKTEQDDLEGARL
jgi:hypothetical protein